MARRGAAVAFLDGVPLRVAETAEVAQAVVSTGNLKSLAQARAGARSASLVEANRGRGYGDFLHYHLARPARMR